MLLLILLLLGAVVGRAETPLWQPENTRVLSLGGAFVALADDPQAGFLNPAGLGVQSSMGYDLHLTTATQHGTDFMTAAMVNTSTEGGNRFAAGIWTQGMLRENTCKWTVPYMGSTTNPMAGLNIGIVTRLPVHYGGDGCPEKSKWAVADLSVLQSYSGFQLGAQVERAIGGGGDVIPRRLRAGVAYRHESGVAAAYEWRSEPLERRWDFHYASSHAGFEFSLGDYAIVRTGYIWAAEHRFTYGLAIGTLRAGWRIEAGWDTPTAGPGNTRWSGGLVYRFGK